MLEVTLEYSKATKNTHVYADKAANAPIPTLYIKKTDMPDEAPAEIVVSVNWDA